MVWRCVCSLSSNYLISPFSNFELFLHLRYDEWVLCERNFLDILVLSFETLQMFCSWSEDVLVVWTMSNYYYIFLFTFFNLRILAISDAMSQFLVRAASPTNINQHFANVLFMVKQCACALVIFIKLFIFIFSNFELSNFYECVLYEPNSSHSFILIFLKLCRCFVHGMKVYMWFGQFCFVLFFQFFQLCQFSA